MVDLIQPEFRSAVNSALQACLDRFKRGLLAVYLAGSVGLGEALAGVSDLDCFVFLSEEPSADDRTWRQRTESELAARYPHANGFHLNLAPLTQLVENVSWRFILQHSAVRLCGADLLADLEAEGVHTPTVVESREHARQRMQQVSSHIDAALAGTMPALYPPLPGDPALAVRKLARTFMIQEGGYLLMALGRFHCFRRTDILPELQGQFPQWTDLVDLTESVLADPCRCHVSLQDYARALRRFFADAARVCANDSG